MFEAVKQELSAFYKERDEVIDGSLTALVAREHVFLLGLPGTAKSLLVRDLCSRIEGARYFEWLLTKFSTPEELFGPVSLKALENDEYRRITKGKLPEAEIVFLDEIFKASAGILNALLSVVNERVYHNNSHPQEVPVEMLVGASNEIPTEPELQALYDRLLLRYHVKPIQQAQEFLDMVSTRVDRSPGEAKIDRDELHKAQKLAWEVETDGMVLNGLLEIRRGLAGAGIEQSDRRWKKSLHLVRARALLHGREQAKPEDLVILSHTMWDAPEQARKVERVVAEIAAPLAAKALDYDDMIEEIKRNVLFNPDGTPNTSPDPNLGAEATSKLKELTSEISSLVKRAREDGNKDGVTRLESVLRKARAVNRQVCEVALGVDIGGMEELKKAEEVA